MRAALREFLDYERGALIDRVQRSVAGSGSANSDGEFAVVAEAAQALGELGAVLVPGWSWLGALPGEATYVRLHEVDSRFRLTYDDTN